MHFYQFNIGDYATSTQHLEPLEDLAYRRMLDLYYSKESPLPKDINQIARLIRMRTHCECIESVLQEFFELTADGYRNNGADKVLNKTYRKSESARKSAEARWSKNKDLDKCERNANAMRKECEGNATQDPLPNTQDPFNTNVPPEPKRKKFTDEDMRFSKEMHKRLLLINPSALEPNFDSWANTIRLCRERDKRTLTDLWVVFDWANKDSFWQSNILSPNKLREKFDQLKVKSNETNQQATNGRGRKLNAVEEANQRLFEKYGNNATYNERAINQPIDTGLDQHQVCGGVPTQMDSSGITVDMDSGYIDHDSGTDT